MVAAGDSALRIKPGSPPPSLAGIRCVMMDLDGTIYEGDTLPDDIQALAVPVLAHRLVLSLDASLRDASVDSVLDECVRGVAVPPVFKK